MSDWWRVEGGTLYITLTGNMANYSYSGYNRAPWYSYRDSITSVSIADSVTSIGNYAFYDCTNLTSATIGNGVTSIGDGAFYYCLSLTSITIGSGVASIGNSAFSSCDSLTAFLVDSNNQNYNSVNGVLFNKNLSTLVSYPKGITGEYAIPNSVTAIGNSAFSSCEGLTSVTIPDSVTSIGYNAFFNCSSLTSVTISDSVTTIGDQAFMYCENLTTVTIPNGVTDISDYAFSQCHNLASVTIPDSVTYIGDSAFSGCDNLESLILSDSVTIIGSYAFDYAGLGEVDNVYYTGTEAQWNEIYIADGNESLTSGVIHFNYEPSPPQKPPVPIAPGAFTVTVSYTRDGQTYTTSFQLNMVAEYYEITPPAKLTYVAGETLDATGLSVTRHSSDGTSADVTSGCTLSPAAGTPVTQATTVSVQYGGAEIGSFDVSVITLESVAITAYPTAAWFAVGDTLDYSGLAVTATYSDGTTADVTDACVKVPAEGSTAAQAGTVTVVVTYQGASAGTFQVAVVTQSSVAITSYPKTTYNVGDTISYAGLVVTATYSNGGTRDVTADCTVSPAEGTAFMLPGNVTVSVSYGGASVGTFIVSAYPVEASGDWWAYGGGVLRVYCNGAMPNYQEEYGANHAPWGDYANSITSVIFGDSVTTIGNAAFCECNALTSVTIPDGVTSIGYCAFALCDALASVTMPNSVIEIQPVAFQACPLTSVTIPNGVSTIKDTTFGECRSLASVTIPVSVTKIEHAAFDLCTSLTDVYYAGTEAQWNAITIETSYNSRLISATKHYNAA